MASDQTIYCTFLDKKSQSKFLFYTRSKNGTFNICLTDVCSVWSADCSQDLLDHTVRQTFALGDTEEKLLDLRPACLRGDVSVVVRDTAAELCVGASPGELRVQLSRMEPRQAAEELKELLFTMADRLCASVFRSPLKTQQRRPAESEPKHNPAPSLKKRPAGASLINPGAKRKVEAAGVTFDDPDP